MRDRERQKKPNWLSLAVVLLLVAPEIVLPIGVCAGIGYLVFKLVKENAYRTRRAKAPATDVEDGQDNGQETPENEPQETPEQVEEGN